MAEIQKLSVAELDFDTIKANLKDYFGSQSEFTDHNFDGSAISVLLDILAYNTHYNAYYLNMLASESFLDSAQLRDSVVAKASMLGYVPKSTRGAQAYVDLTITASDSPATITVDKDTQFTSTVNGTSYTFATANSTVISPINGAYVANNVLIRQGVPLTFKYTVNTANTEQKFLLPNENTDTNTLVVSVQESVSDTNTSVYALATDITTVNATSNVYFMNEHTEGQFRVQFGDGVLGRKPITGNIVFLNSLIAEGTVSNGANTFSAAGTVGGYSTVSVVTSTSAIGGLNKETIESIKFNAPKNYEAQNRAVTTDDYKKIVEDNVAGLDTVAVWGGQDNDTPKFGTVFVSAKPAGADALSTSQKTLIKAALTDYNIVAITPEVVDPDLISLIFSLTVKYDSRKTTDASGIIAASVIDTIQTYKTNNLNKFGSIFRYSVLSKQVDARAAKESYQCVIVSAAIESQITEFNNEKDKLELLHDLNLTETTCNKVVYAGYNLLNLITFFSSELKETRAWTITKNTKAPKAAGKIHTDFEKGFICAETISFDDFVDLKGEIACREAGKLRQEGKDYIVEDGDVLHFLFNI